MGMKGINRGMKWLLMASGNKPESTRTPGGTILKHKNFYCSIYQQFGMILLFFS